MGICPPKAEYSRPVFNNLTINQQISLKISDKTHKNRPKLLQFTLKPAELHLSGTLSQQYFSIKYSGVVLPGQDPNNFHSKSCQDTIFIRTIDDVLIAGLFDGHGENGQSIVNFCVSYMTAYIQLHFSAYQDDLKTFLNLLITSCDTQLRTCSEIDTKTSGTTAICLIIKNNLLFIASVGDSRGILANSYTEPLNATNLNNPYKINVEVNRNLGFKNLTVDQKPDLECEKKRILDCGGKVQRSVNKFGQFAGPFRVWKQSGGVPGLAMSRSIGDEVGKEIGVIAEPICEVVELKSGLDLFLIIASDGIWDVIDSQEAVNYVECFRNICTYDAIPKDNIYVSHK